MIFYYSPYVIEYNNPLTISQVSNVVNSMINQFPGNCHPQNISTSPGSHNVNLRFSSICMDGQVMADVGNRTMTRYNQDNTVKSVMLDNSQIWPI
jgi:hypothetical protein